MSGAISPRERGVPAPARKKSDDDVKFLLDVLTNNRHVFNSLNERELETLTNAFEYFGAKRGQTIVRQGERGEHFYILQRGKLTFVTSNGIQLGSATVPGNSFGQLALMEDAPHAATCMAVDGEAVLWRIDKETFLKFVSRGVRERRGLSI